MSAILLCLRDLLDRLPMDALRVAVLFAFTLAALPLLRRSPAATRRLALTLALSSALVLPAVSAFAPAWRMDAPIAVSSLRGIIVAEAPVDPVTGGAAATRSPEIPETAIGRAGSARRINPAHALWITWAAGALVVLARLALGVARTRAILKRSTEASSWHPAAARAAARVGLRVHVRMTSELDAPAVTGIFTPVVLVPLASASWSDDRRYAVLLHELAHVRQHDCLGHVVAQLVCAVHWFDPMAWLVARRLRVERELAADDAVIVAGARASSYAEDLLAIAGAVVRQARPVPFGALGMAERSQLAERVVAIVSGDRARRPPGRAGAALLAAAFSAGLLAIACTTPTASRPAATSGLVPLPVAPPASPSPAAASPQSTLDPRLQAIADDELDRAMREWSAAAGALIVLDPTTGEILADSGRAHGAPADVAVGTAYLTGSTLKGVTLAAALEEGVLSPTESIDCGPGKWPYDGKTMQDWRANGVLTVAEMLAVSSNIGVAKVFDRLGGSRLDHWLRAFHFGVAPAVEGASSGVLAGPFPDHSYEGAVTAIGEKMTASPLQVAAAYAALANGGVYVPPTRTRRTGEVPHERLIRPDTARTIVTLLEAAVNDEKATGSLARIDGPRVAGKTGTAAWDLPGGKEGIYASFVGFFPSTAPRFVILVGLEQPKGGEGGGNVAAPVFARVATRALAAR